MSVPVLEALADAIYNEEGNRPPDRAYRNRNPGNLRPTDPSQPHDDGNYRVFATFEEGYSALLHDLLCKVTGHNVHSLNQTSTLYNFAEVWAPSSDHQRLCLPNVPLTYAQGLAAWMGKALGVVIESSSSFVFIFNAAGQDYPVYVEPAA